MVCVLKVRPCEKCDKRAYFNTPEQKPPRFCKEHRELGMINVIAHKCQDLYCTKLASFNYEGQTKFLYCSEHKKDGMVLLGGKKCIFETCTNKNKNGDKYKGYCFRCYMHLFPDAPTTNRFKTKEMKVRDFLKTTWPDVTIIHDKRVECHLYRPDFVIDLGSHLVVIEVDENQHETYDTSCDNKRLMSIFQGLGSRPMVMIRFNPDSYDDMKGCWTRNGNLVEGGRPWRKRLAVLETRVNFWLKNEPSREVTIEHLFYDGFTGLS